MGDNGTFTMQPHYEKLDSKACCRSKLLKKITHIYIILVVGIPYKVKLLESPKKKAAKRRIY